MLYVGVPGTSGGALAVISATATATNTTMWCSDSRIAAHAGGAAYVERRLFAGGSSSNSGANAALLLFSSVVHGCHASQGGGFAVARATATLSDSVVDATVSSSFGGGGFASVRAVHLCSIR